MQKRFRGVACITYEIELSAESAEDAQNTVMELLSDDVTQGIIRMDLFDNDEDGPGYRYPFLLPITMKEVVDEA